MRLHRDVSTHKSFYTQRLLHKDTFAHRSFYTEKSFRQRNLYTEELSHREVFTQRRFYTQMLLHKETFTHRSFYTHKTLHKKLLHEQTCTQRSFYRVQVPPGNFFRFAGDFFSGTLLYHRRHHQPAGGCAKPFEQEHALVSAYSGRISRCMCQI